MAAAVRASSACLMRSGSISKRSSVMFARRLSATRTRSSFWWRWAEAGGSESAHPRTAVTILAADSQRVRRRPSSSTEAGLKSSPEKTFYRLARNKTIRYRLYEDGSPSSVANETGPPKVARWSEVRGRQRMRKLFLAVILLAGTASTAVLAHSGTDQEEQACTRDAQRFCRKVIDQGDLTVLVCLKENRAKLSAACRYVLVSHGQ